MRNLQQLENEAPIIQHALDLYKALYEDLKKFPKKDQYLLGKRCEDTMLDFLEYILLASSASKDQKSRYLTIAAAKFDVLKVLLRVARELKVLDNKNYIALQLRIQETGKMLGGWLRSVAIKTSA